MKIIRDRLLVFFMGMVIVFMVSCAGGQKEAIFSKKPFPLREIDSDFLDFYENIVYPMEVFPSDRNIYLGYAIKRMKIMRKPFYKLLSSALIYFYAGELDKSYLAFRKAKSISKNINILDFIDFYLARIYIDIDRIDEAYQIFTNLTKRKSPYYLCYYYMGIIFLKQGDVNKAKNYILWLSKKYPFMRNVYVRMLFFLGLMEKYRGIEKYIFGDYFRMPVSKFSLWKVLLALYGEKADAIISNKERLSFIWVNMGEFLDVLFNLEKIYGKRVFVCKGTGKSLKISVKNRYYQVLCFLVERGFIAYPLSGKFSFSSTVSHSFVMNVLYELRSKYIRRIK